MATNLITLSISSHRKSQDSLHSLYQTHTAPGYPPNRYASPLGKLHRAKLIHRQHVLVLHDEHHRAQLGEVDWKIEHSVLPVPRVDGVLRHGSGAV